MDLSIESNDKGVVRVKVKGQIVQTALNMPPEPLGQLLGDGAYGHKVVMNLGEATFIDSSGLGWLLMCHRRFRDAAGRFILHSMPPMVSDVVKVMRLDQVLKIVEDEGSALSAVGAEA